MLLGDLLLLLPALVDRPTRLLQLAVQGAGEGILSPHTGGGGQGCL